MNRFNLSSLSSLSFKIFTIFTTLSLSVSDISYIQYKVKIDCNNKIILFNNIVRLFFEDKSNIYSYEKVMRKNIGQFFIKFDSSSEFIAIKINDKTK